MAICLQRRVPEESLRQRLLRQSWQELSVRRLSYVLRAHRAIHGLYAKRVSQSASACQCYAARGRNRTQSTAQSHTVKRSLLRLFSTLQKVRFAKAVVLVCKSGRFGVQFLSFWCAIPIVLHCNSYRFTMQNDRFYKLLSRQLGILSVE